MLSKNYFFLAILSVCLLGSLHAQQTVPTTNSNSAAFQSVTTTGVGNSTLTLGTGAGTGVKADGALTNSQNSGTQLKSTMQLGLQPSGLDNTKSGADAPSSETSTANLNRTIIRPPQPNQFQRFVQEATGRVLRVYGSEFFEGTQAYTPDASLPASNDYVLGAGDEVRIQIWGAVDYTGSHTIDRNGQITLPKLGVVALAGVPVRELEAVLRRQIGKVYTNYNVNANLGRLRSIQVYVVGLAKQPGTYNVSSLSTLVNALFASGGPSDNGSMRNIALKRDGRIVTTIDMYDFIAKGDKGRDVPLKAGDVIVIPPVGARVAVTGAFDHAAIYELKPGTNTVGEILNLSGGVPALASTLKALIERIDPAKNPPRQVQDIALNAQGLGQALRDGDVVTLLAISPAFANAVTLQGTVAAALRYRWFEGMKILDLIPERDALISPDYYKRKNLLVQSTDLPQEAGGKIVNRVRGIADQINWEYAVIERLDRNKLTIELIPFNLGKVVLQKDLDQNLPLQPGDVVTIFSQNDLRLPQEKQTRLVRVEGEVAAPGIYQVLPGETLDQLLKRIGGLTPQSYVFGLEFNRESVRVRQQENLDTVIRRLEAQSLAQSSNLIANLTGERAAQSQAQQQQQQIQLKAQIERLKALRSNGRMTLELDPQGTTLADLPTLLLEDGDRIVVPSVPSFVAAAGSVYNENVFIFKANKSVGEVLKSAGLTEEADPDQAFVLRADGSIIARRDHSSFFRSSFESIKVMPGDTIVVPALIDRESRYNFVTRVLKDWTQIFSNFGLGVVALKTIRTL